MSDEENKSWIRTWLDSLLVRIPELVLAFIGGVGYIVFTIWLSSRSFSDKLVAIDEYIEKDSAHMEQLADCVKRAECEAVRALIHAHELRLTAVETRVAGHEQVSRERVERMNEIEREQRRIATQQTARPDSFSFTGTEGRVLKDQLDMLQRQVRDMRIDSGGQK